MIFYRLGFRCVAALFVFANMFGSIALAQAVLSVKAVPASELFVHPKREAQATVQARNESRISAEVSAVIDEVAVDVGQRVGAGDVLAKLDDTDVRLSMAQAVAARDGLKARLQLARRQLRRLRELKSNNFVSTEAVNQRDAEVVSLRAELQGADARVAVIKRQLIKCVVRAPFDAVVAERQAQLGEFVAPGSPLVTLVQLGQEEVSALVSTRDAPTVASPGLVFRFVAHGNEHAVTLDRISPLVSSQTRTREARFTFTGESFPSGTQGVVRWSDSQAHLPPSVMVQRAGKLGVFLATDGVAQFLAIEGAQEGRPVATDLDPGSLVIVQGQAKAQDGVGVEQLQ